MHRLTRPTCRTPRVPVATPSRTPARTHARLCSCYKITDMSLRYLMQIRPTLLVYHKHRDFYKPLTERDLR
jgi:hypothetical protein